MERRANALPPGLNLKSHHANALIRKWNEVKFRNERDFLRQIQRIKG